MDGDLAQALKSEARRVGFDMAGVVPATPARRLDAYLAWIEAGRHGSMGYMARPDRVERRLDPSRILPGVQSIVCVGLGYATLALPEAVAADPARGRIANYAWAADYHDVMTPRLEALADWLAARVAGPVANRVYVDTGAILERDHAEAAGLGFTGKNTMLIGPRRGSWFFLGELLTTAALTPDVPAARQPSCGSCRRCLDACPTGAFPVPYVLDARRCISYLTIERKGWIPGALRPLMGNWIYGCDICQDVCPFNRFAPPSLEPAFWAASIEAMAPPLEDLLALDREAFAARYAHGPIRRLGWERFLRNVCVAAGNWGNEQAVHGLVRLLATDAPLVRGHAAWALGRVGVTETTAARAGAAKAAMQNALAGETDERVREELQGALAGRV